MIPARLVILIGVLLAACAPGTGVAADAAFLGAGLRDLDAAEARAMGAPGAFVGAVAPDGPAARAGIQPRDVITHVDRRPVAAAADVPRAVAARRPGDVMEVTVVRDGRRSVVRVTLGVAPGGTGGPPTAGGPAGPTPQPRAAAAGGWQMHRNPQGFELRHPPGWVVETPGSQLIVARSQDGASFALVRPFVHGRATCATFLRESFSTPSNRFPGAQVVNVVQRRASPDEAIASVRFAGGRSRANVMCSLAAGSGMLFAIAAPEPQFDGQKDMLIEILKSFTVRPPAGGPPGGGGTGGGGAVAPVAYGRFVDPREGAFTVDVPRGWQTQGGLFRRSAIDVTVGLRTTSPDGNTTIFLGDPELRLASWSDSFAGREGQMYDPGFGTQMIMLRYRPGVDFASQYVSRFVGSLGLAGVQVRDRRDRPDIAGAGPQGAGGQRSTSGEVSFTADRRGQPQAGYVLATTTMWPAPGGYQWNAGVLGYATPLGQVSTTSSILGHMLASARANPQWQAQQQQTTGATANIVGQAGQDIARIHSQSYWARQQVQGQVMQRQSDATLGNVRVRDPETGREFVTTAGKNYYYLPQGSDVPFGTNQTDRPNIDVTELAIVR